MQNVSINARLAPQTLNDGLAAVVQRCGTAIALRMDEQAITFQALDENSNCVAHGLRLLLKAGDRIALIARDSLASYELLFGCSKAGCILVPINWRLTGNELAKIIRDSCSNVLFVDAVSLEKLRAADANLIATTHVIEMKDYIQWRQRNETANLTPHTSTTDTPIVQIYTSGTTGLPKGVVLAHRTFFQLLHGMRSHGDTWMNLCERDVLLLSLPQFHIGGLWWAVQGLLAGSCGVLIDTFVGWKALKLIEQHRITKVAMVPAMIQFVLAEPDIASVDLSSVTGFLYGGSPIASELLQRAIDKFACPFFQIYGLTETGNMAVCLRPEDHAHRSLWPAAGRALPGVQLKILNAEQQPCDTNQIGEVWIKSPSVMLEYWNNPYSTAEVLQDGWFRSGDAGYIDAQGYMFVCDRIKDMIIYAGENIYPAEIESVLLSHPAVAEAAVIGIPDEQFGERAKAFLVLARGAEQPKARELLQHCRQHLADFKIPKSFDFIDSIPRNPSGKILKHVLRKPYWENLTRQVN